MRAAQKGIGAPGRSGGGAARVPRGVRGAAAGEGGGQGDQPRPRPAHHTLKSLALEFDRLALDVRYGRVDVPAARVILAALDRELRCLETALRYGLVRKA